MSLCLIPIGVLIAQGFFYPKTMYAFTRGEIWPQWSLSKN